ncbi:MAG: lactate racemase domain-containing protein [Oscillospiraceae bacterium]|nr:lactate racemase domain-containing protein [Oscillospiraceae bacterium]
MNNKAIYAPDGGVITDAELETAIRDSISDIQASLKRVLLIVPDYTRYHSDAGKIANIYYHLLKDTCAVELLEALGTHVPMTQEECADMYGDIPFERFISHNWRTDVIKLGEVPASYVAEVSEGVMEQPIDVEVNKRLFDSYDLILSIGQVVPHEVVGMANQSKNIFVGVGGNSMINTSHILGAFYGMERMMGRDATPVRKVFDYAQEHFLSELPLHYVLTVTTAPGGNIRLHGLFIGRERSYFEKAVALAQQTNLTFVDAPLKKVVVLLDGKEFKSTWLGNKSIYRTRMAIADGGELIVLAPGVEKFGEDDANDKLIREYGYCGRLKVIELCKTQDDLKENLSAAAHLIHGSSDGRFSITYCTRHLTRAEVEGACFNYMPYDEAVKRYDPAKLQPGFNTLADGEEIYYIPNPALGLWADKNKY